jgi:hypothetical protein
MLAVVVLLFLVSVHSRVRALLRMLFLVMLRFMVVHIVLRVVVRVIGNKSCFCSSRRVLARTSLHAARCSHFLSSLAEEAAVYPVCAAVASGLVPLLGGPLRTRFPGDEANTPEEPEAAVVPRRDEDAPLDGVRGELAGGRALRGAVGTVDAGRDGAEDCRLDKVLGRREAVAEGAAEPVRLLFPLLLMLLCAAGDVRDAAVSSTE